MKKAVVKETYMLRDLPPEERPRERMIHHGPETMTNADLLAIILRTGSTNVSVQHLSEQVLSHFDGLHGLLQSTVEEITAIKGIGPAKAVQIMAAIELGRRIARHKKGDTYTIRTPEDGANYIMDELRHLQQEVFVTLYLNTKNQVLSHERITTGSLNSSIVHPREIFKGALKRSCASIICIHNHPSGDPSPSREDIEVTKRLVSAGEILGIEVLDHIIIGDNTYYSLKEKGHM
ncbi:hypothetical protein BHU72_12575 [Desulfuribacillus stibiiarsenatis]|uniref:MPN domain-containing protein n=1 Tax=Desulfuribacillus stibiiarsenatis TaxID=1390249 RepID=A0A1E5L249_9FIRM|nr:DNA repair protein RadC [Desulfuribacillus stibiiarsenatis]OEH84232.1 hypothetical protein BHU72_12575 [Desulfuribacillus stibiiarsenatis]